ncbi:MULTISPECIES: flagellar motor protein MotB [unclassified Devosia]|uniref:flagellar motor protein MotB n=1 Tax=unclassified Devosia TaxID=196773 RepID=UPI000FD9FC69|nr:MULTISPECIES: flagellar motor protein MotB [unclassified Devosia]
MAQYNQPIIIKKVKKAAHAHHGGAWKIAYADFVTAMMAFFLLLWLISMTTPEQKEGLADYFAPPSIAPTTSGAGGLLGGTALDAAGAKMAGTSLKDQQEAATSPASTRAGSQEAGTEGIKGETGATETTTGVAPKDLNTVQAFHSAAASIRQAWQALPDITEIADNLLVEATEDGLDIQIIDQEGTPMFPEGSKYPTEPARQAIAALGPILQKLSSQITISGHTAAGGTYVNPRYGSWELSSDRANVVRGLLGEFGLSDDRVSAVSGRASADPFFPNDPYQAANERIKIVVLNQAPPVPAGLSF